MIEQRLAQVGTAKRTILEVASIVGVEFSAAAVAAGADVSVEVVEEQCAELVRQEQFLQTRGTTEWPRHMGKRSSQKKDSRLNRSTSYSGEDWGTYVRGGAVSAEGGADAAVQTSLKQVSDKSKASQKQVRRHQPQPLTPEHQTEVEACFHKAIEIARKQQAKSLELRAGMSLSSAVAAAGQEGRSPADAGGDLRLVH